jgi:hypothetical protein
MPFSTGYEALTPSVSRGLRDYKKSAFEKQLKMSSYFRRTLLRENTARDGQYLNNSACLQLRATRHDNLVDFSAGFHNLSFGGLQFSGR